MYPCVVRVAVVLCRALQGVPVEGGGEGCCLMYPCVVHVAGVLCRALQGVPVEGGVRGVV